ncbi:MAG: D-2-hydroxyacid dehydrogenase [Dehalococcoidia bacterium]
MSGPRLLVSVGVKADHAARLERAAPGLELVAIRDDGSVDGPDDYIDIAFLSPDMWFGASQHLFRYLGRSVKWLHTSSAGVDHPAFKRVLDSGIRLSNGGGTQAKPIAQWVLLFMLAGAKGLRQWEDDRVARRWQSHQSDELTGRVCGVIGLGAIGLEVARLAKCLAMETIGLRRTPTPMEHLDRVLGMEGLDELLAQSDFVVICAPLNEQSRHMIGRDQMARMKPSAWLLNIGRGAIIDEPALIEALQAGQIAGAALDVFEKEPLPDDSPLWTLPNVYVTPHNAGSSPLSVERSVEVFAQNLERFVRDEPLLTEVYEAG